MCSYLHFWNRFVREGVVTEGVSISSKFWGVRGWGNGNSILGHSPLSLFSVIQRYPPPSAQAHHKDFKLVERI